MVASACRTAIGAFGGTLKDTSAVHLAGVVMNEAVSRAGVDPGRVDDIRFGCVFEPIDACNVARVAALAAGLPDTTAAVTINRVCLSGMEAVVSGMAMIQAGMADVVLAGGVESMSTVPYSVPTARWGSKMQDQMLVDDLIHGLHCGSYYVPLEADGPLDVSEPPLRDFIGRPYIMGHTAEFLAQRQGIGREEMDELALRSHRAAERATEDGSFAEEIVPVMVRQKGRDPLEFRRDEHYRPGITLEKLASLSPVFLPKTGTVTAGNASGINDGAAALLIMEAETAEAAGVEPLARLRATGRGACHPAIMGLSPVPAVHDLLRRSGLGLGDFGLIEVNEAFAAQYLAVERELGLDRSITNVNGSGIGLGHPVGATGARVVVTLLHAMRKRGVELGLATLCGGGGVSLALAVEAL